MAMHDAELLHKFSSSTCRGITEVFNDLGDKLSWTGKESILDVGCGSGNVTATVVTKFVPEDSNIIATDISLEMIEFAKKTFKSSKITFELLNILDLDTKWKKQLFNKVFCFYVLQRIIDDKKAYTNMFNLLKPGGEILIVFPGKHGFDEVSPLLAKLQKYRIYSAELQNMKFHISPKEDYVSHTEDVLRSIGFDIVTCKIKTMTNPTNSIDEFVEKYGLTMGRLSEILPEDLFQEAMNEDIRKVVIDNNLYGLKSGFGKIDYELVAAIAKKPL